MSSEQDQPQEGAEPTATEGAPTPRLSLVLLPLDARAALDALRKLREQARAR